MLCCSDELIVSCKLSTAVYPFQNLSLCQQVIAPTQVFEETLSLQVLRIGDINRQPGRKTTLPIPDYDPIS